MRLGFLQELYEQPGPFATVYLDTSGDAEDAAKAVELRWRAAKERLSEQGADSATVQAIEDRIGEHQWQTGKRGQVFVATQGEVVFSDELPEPPTEFSDDELARCGPLPHLMPYLRSRSARIPYVVAVVDHEGADIKAVNAERQSATTSVEGEGHPLHKTRSGYAGNEQHYQHSVEEQWRRNADEVVKEISKQASRLGVDMIVLAGDVQQRQLVRKELGKGLRERVVEIETGQRAQNVDEESMGEEVSEAIRSVVEARVAETVEAFQRERGRRERAVEGWQQTVGALQREQVQTVLWSVVPGKTERDVPVGPAAGHIALDDRELAGMGVDQVEHVPASEAVVRSLVSSDAELVLVEPDRVELSEGVGAVLRYSDT